MTSWSPPTAPAGRSWPARWCCSSRRWPRSARGSRSVRGRARRSRSSRLAHLDSERAEEPEQRRPAPREGGCQRRRVAAARPGGARSAGCTSLAHYVAGDKVPRSTTVSGVRHRRAPAGTRRPSGSQCRPRRAGRPRHRRRPSRAGRWRSTPAEAGLGVDYEASVAEAGGETSWDPVRLWNYFTGGDELRGRGRPSTTTAYNAASPASTSSTARRARRQRSPSTGSEIETTAGPHRQALDPADTLAALQGAFLEEEPDVVALEMADVQPDDRLLRRPGGPRRLRLARRRGPVTLSFEGSDVKLFPADYTARCPGPDRRRAGADARRREAHRGGRLQGDSRARRVTRASPWSTARRRSSPPSRA